MSNNKPTNDKFPLPPVPNHDGSDDLTERLENPATEHSKGDQLNQADPSSDAEPLLSPDANTEPQAKDLDNQELSSLAENGLSHEDNAALDESTDHDSEIEIASTHLSHDAISDPTIESMTGSDSKSNKEDSNKEDSNNESAALNTSALIATAADASANEQFIIPPTSSNNEMAPTAEDYSVMSSPPQSFISAFLQTLAAIFKDKGVLLMLIIAPIIYGFFYPWPYSTEVVNQVPVGIIDYDNSNLSKTLIRYSAASPQLNAHIFVNEQAAIEAIWKDQIAGYMVIPSGLENKVKSGQAASVSVVGNGGYFLLNKNIQLGFLKAVGTVSAGIEVKKNVAKGAYLPSAKASTQAIPLSITPLYNQSEGYGAYVVPGVSILILQQTLLMGTALLIGTLYEQRRHHTSAQGWLGRIFALSLIGFIMGCFYYGWVFDIHHYARGANLVGSLIFLAVFFPAVAALGCFLGLWFKERERGLQILIVSSLPLFFVSGYPWPVDQLPIVLQYLRWLIPTSSGINTSVQLNQMGASLSHVWPNLVILAGLFVFYYLCLLTLESSRKQRHLP